MECVLRGKGAEGGYYDELVNLLITVRCTVTVVLVVFFPFQHLFY